MAVWDAALPMRKDPAERKILPRPRPVCLRSQIRDAVALSLQTTPAMGSVNGSEGPWLQRFANGKPVRKPKRQQPWRVPPDQSRDIIASAQCILDRENFVREMDRYLKHNDFLHLRKTELLYKKYLENVSEPFMQKMKDQMVSQSQKEVWKRRQEQYSQYLNYCTKKGYVFLDDYDPSEYDPFFQKTCTDCWKVMKVINQNNDRDNDVCHLCSS